jgi:hypothetical protein
MEMKNAFFVLALLAGVTLAGVPAMAGERLNDGLMGAGAGALVGGPVGAVVGGGIGYTAGPGISHGYRSHHHYHHRYYHHYYH